MAGSEKGSSAWLSFEDLAKAIDAVTNLYSVVSAKSPFVADTILILIVLIPFYAIYAWTSGTGRRERQANLRVKNARQDSKKAIKHKPGVKKP